MHPCAASQIEQHRFRAIVAMVCYAYAASGQVFGETVEISVAKVSCRHFDADVVECRIGLCVEMYEVEFYAETLTQVLAELFVTV